MFTPMKNLLLALLLLNVTSCGCWGENSNSKACVVARQIVDCTVDAAKNLGPVAAGILETYVIGNADPDWAAIDLRLEGAGVADAGCILAQLENDFFAKSGASAMYAAKAKGVSSHFTTWKTAHGLGNVKFKIKNPDGTVVTR